MRKTYWYEKFYSSIINVGIVFIVFIPFYFLPVSLFSKKLILLSLFFFYNTGFIILEKNNRCLGMIITGKYWKKKYPFKQRLLYVVLYTLSYGTIFFYIFFPFDLLIFNLLVLQLPTILIKKTTFHGYLSGNMVTVKKSR